MESYSLGQGTLYFDGVPASQILARAPSTEELSIEGGTYSFSSAQVFDRNDQATLKEKRRLWRDSAAVIEPVRQERVPYKLDVHSGPSKPNIYPWFSLAPIYMRYKCKIRYVLYGHSDYIRDMASIAVFLKHAGDKTDHEIAQLSAIPDTVLEREFYFHVRFESRKAAAAAVHNFRFRFASVYHLRDNNFAQVIQHDTYGKDWHIETLYQTITWVV